MRMTAKRMVPIGLAIYLVKRGRRGHQHHHGVGCTWIHCRKRFSALLRLAPLLKRNTHCRAKHLCASWDK